MYAAWVPLTSASRSRETGGKARSANLPQIVSYVVFHDVIDSLGHMLKEAENGKRYDRMNRRRGLPSHHSHCDPAVGSG